MNQKHDITLYDYWRSSASYRVRIALNLKGLEYRSHDVSLVEGGQSNADYLARNPQGLVPLLEVDGEKISQSLAMLDYLDHLVAEPAIFPKQPLACALALANAMVIIADIHPIDNLRVLKYLKTELEQDQQAVDNWYRHWIIKGFAALEQRAPDQGFFDGERPGLVEICLVPQIYNARRFDTPMDDFPKLVRIDAACNALSAFDLARPENVKP